ncbi:hypothetical protein SAMN05216464_10236 [Mucilaginibacter pineti]|uniref:DUF4412 domain-containing protein n=1 Tax=Mucilaginibacter pineti TaxID=1391627 RepID=A0A1G6W5L8_9SPHI|nr:DUF6263 family protein [Mucilaginibacter pineti]SDD60316.1 hypothetical protein SAMN05216464_10236 [Mucilaginibacter pineti]
MKHLFNLLMLLTATLACQAQKFKPALHLTKGNTYDMITSTSSAIQQTMNGQVNNINIAINGTTSFKVLNADDSLYYMEVNYKSLGMKMQMAGSNANFDSNKSDSTDIMSSILKGLVNKPFTAIITKSGKIKSVENAEKMISSVLDGFPQIQGAQKEQVKTQFLKSFGSEAIKTSLEMSTAVFPEKAVAKNEKWTIVNNIETTMTAKVSTVYQLTDVSPTSYIIHGDGAIVTDNATGYKQISGMPMQYNMKGTSTADIKADKVTGWITEAKIKQQISGTVNIKDNPQVPGGASFPMTVTNETITTDK